jgi:hypothetical protein
VVRGFRHGDVAGANSLTLSQTTANNVLKPGRYLLVATPTAGSGTPGPPSQAHFVVRT